MNQALKGTIVVITLALFVSLIASCSGQGGNTPASGTTNNSAGDADSNAAKSRSNEYPPLASGLASADLELMDGSKFKLTDKKGKVLLVNIWGTWCGPCREEMPHLVELQNKYGAQGFEVVGLNIGDGSGSPESNEQIQTFAERMKLNYTLARSPNSATIEFYKITKQQVVPQTLLVDREGHLRGVFIGGGQRVIDSMKSTLEKTMSEG